MISTVASPNVARKQKLIKNFMNEHNGGLILSRLLSHHRKCREKLEVAHRSAHGLYLAILIDSIYF